MNGLVDFMKSNPHEGHALNEVWLVALVATHESLYGMMTRVI